MSQRLPTLAFVVVAAVMGSTPGAGRPSAVVTRVPLPEGFRPQVLAAADFTGDEATDIAFCSDSGRLLVLAGDGRGGLHAVPGDASCGEHPTAITAADLDDDGRTDLVVANHETDHLTVLRNVGGGRMRAETVQVASKPHPHAIAAADVDGDGRLDLVTDSWQDRRLLIVSADGRGGWQSPGRPIAVARAPYANILALDLDGDGHVDLAFPNAAPDSAANTVSILFGDGRGGFQPAAQSPLVAGPAPFRIAAGDVDGDGRPDLLATNYSGHSSDTSKDGISWVRNDGGRRFTAFPTPLPAGPGPWVIAAGDANGDGLVDAAVIEAASDQVRFAFGSRSGLRIGPEIAVMPGPHALAFADLRHEGRADLLVITAERDELLIVSLR